MQGRLCHADCLEKVIGITAPTSADVAKSRTEDLAVISSSPEEVKAAILSEIKEGNTPLEFQWVAPEWVDNKNGKAVIADEMGLGKSIEAILWLAKHPEARPAFVFCPNSVKLNWRREIKKWLKNTGKKQRNRVFVLTGKKSVKLPNYGIFVCNYDIADSWKDEIVKAGPQAVICDEVHYLKNPKAKRTVAILGPMSVTARKKNAFIAKAAPYVIGMSGTPITNRPIEFFPILHTVAPHIFPSYMDYAKRYCAAHQSKYGWIMTGASNIPELADLLRTHVMLRRTKEQVLKDLPDKRRALVPLPISNKSDYEFAQKDLLAWLKSQDQDISGALKAEALVKFEKLKQLAAQGKIDAALEWITDFLETGQKLVLAVHHRDIGMRILAGVNKYNPVAISGGDTAEARQNAVDKFQNDDTCRVAVVSITAGSTGITLTAASSIATLELLWNPATHNQMEDRLHRIGQKDSVTSYYLLASDTIEEDIAGLIDSKRPVVAGVLGDAPVEGDTDILGSVVTKFLEAR